MTIGQIVRIVSPIGPLAHLSRENEMTGQKQIATVLDRAASRSSSPPSSKHVWFLAGLIARSDSAEIDYQDWLLNGAGLSRGDASTLIDGYLRAEKLATVEG